MVGTGLADGYVYEKKKEWKYNNGLHVTDKEYVEEYSRCTAIVLGRKESKIRLGKDGRWRVEHSSVAFYYWQK